MKRFTTIFKTLQKRAVRGYATNEGCCVVTDNLQKEMTTVGQVTSWTHPHLFDLEGDEVTPGITKQEFQARRDKYVEYLSNYQRHYFKTTAQPEALGAATSVQHSTSNFIAVIPSCMTSFMAPDVPYTFKQNSDFLYLTGFQEPNSLLVLSRTNRDSNSSSYKTALFVREKDSRKEVWEGAYTGAQNVSRVCGIDTAHGVSEFETYIQSLLNESENKKMAMWRYPSEIVMKEESGPNCYNEQIETALDSLCVDNSDKLIVMNDLAENVLHSSRYYVQLARIKKSKAEIELMRKSCDIASAAFVNTMLASHPNVNESLIYAKFDYECRTRGAEHLAYIPVIAGGPRATILHYIRNNQLISNGRLLLMDAGCQYRDYASDITRTWPINGQFNGPQRDIYEACLNVQQYCLDKCQKGVTINKLYACMIYKIGEQLVQLGIIRPQDIDLSQPDKLNMMTQKRISQYCPHDIGHYLGLDVHDSPEVSKSVELEPGTVITVEPGIYFKPDDASVPQKYRGIGIRIEDDVVITESGYDILSKNCPKKIEDIENLIKIKKKSQ